MSKNLKVSIALAALFSSAAFAQYPDHAVTVIVPFIPGGSVDPAARAIETTMQAEFGAPFVIENNPGASGTIGTAKVARAAPDGYTIGITTVGPLTTQPHLMKLSYGVDDFTYICRTHVTPQVLVVPIDSPYKSLQALVDDARKHPDKVSFASSGVGSLPHLASVEFGNVAGFKWLHVPTKGDGESIALALSGSITGWVAGVQSVSRLSTRLRALGILEAERISTMPDVPTFREQGFNVVSSAWGGMIAPKGIPKDVIDKLSKGCEKGVKSPAFEAMLKSLMIPQGYLPASEFAPFVKKEFVRYGRLIEATPSIKTH